MKGWFEKLRDGAPGRCGLRIDGPRTAETVEEAWALLPARGEGWVCMDDQVRLFEPSRREGLLLHAEVADGDRTVVLRHDDGRWRAWTWTEGEGDDHRFVRERYLSSIPRQGEAIPHMEITTYWTRRDDDGLRVWRPVGARFSGWKEAS